jgi:hypothetical protein
MEKTTNRLINEKSPYLFQHAYNFGELVSVRRRGICEGYIFPHSKLSRL